MKKHEQAFNVYDEFISLYDEIIKLDRSNIEYCNQLSQLLYTLKRFKESADVYDNFTEMNPQNLEAFTQKVQFILTILAQILLKQQKYDAATQVHNLCIQLNPRQIQAIINKSQMLNSIQYLDKALEMWDNYTQQDPLNIQAFEQKLLILYEQQIDNKEAQLEIYDQIIRINPLNYQHHHYKIKYLQSQGDNENVLGALNHYRNLVPNNLHFLIEEYKILIQDEQNEILAKKIIKQIKMVFTLKVYILNLLIVQFYIDIGHLDQALKIQQGLTMLQTDDFTYYEKISQQFIQQNKFDEALKVYDIKLYENSNKYDDAIKLCEQLFLLDLEDYNSIKQKFYFLNIQTKYDQALAVVQDNIKKYPQKQDAYYDQNIIFIQIIDHILKLLNKFQETIPIYNQIIKLSPQTIQNYFDKIEIHKQLNQLVEADKVSNEEYLLSHPTIQIYQHKKALALYDQLLEIDQSDNHYYGKSELLLKQGENQKTFEIYDLVITNQPANLNGYSFKVKQYELELNKLEKQIIQQQIK
ncbi:hypothetical protein pb186bvf_004758 [Paramecium bursaria]